MTARIRAFFNGASKAYDVYGSLREEKRITISNGFENIGKALKKTINQNEKSSSKTKQQSTK
ncbi:MAG: hypothetical protein PUI85_02205 [Eubacteriales bacterium]|nr:hypothetical protein [Eubacteriales bacterium]